MGTFGTTEARTVAASRPEADSEKPTVIVVAAASSTAHPAEPDTPKTVEMGSKGQHEHAIDHLTENETDGNQPVPAREPVHKSDLLADHSSVSVSQQADFYSMPLKSVPSTSSAANRHASLGETPTHSVKRQAAARAQWTPSDANQSTTSTATTGSARKSTAIGGNQCNHIQNQQICVSLGS